jgi:hypothetical protein
VNANWGLFKELKKMLSMRCSSIRIKELRVIQ